MPILFLPETQNAIHLPARFSLEKRGGFYVQHTSKVSRIHAGRLGGNLFCAIPKNLNLS